MEMCRHVDGPSRAIDSLRATVALRMAAWPTCVGLSGLPIDGLDGRAREASAWARRGIVRSAALAPKLSMALEGPSTCRTTSQISNVVSP